MIYIQNCVKIWAEKVRSELTLQEIREMVKEMFLVEAKWLPQFEMEIVQRW